MDELLLNGGGGRELAGPMTEGSEQSLPATDQSIVSMLAARSILRLRNRRPVMPKGSQQNWPAKSPVLPGQTESWRSLDARPQTGVGCAPGQGRASAATNES